MKRFLVTGGTIGNHVAEGLAAKGVAVRLLVRTVSTNPRWQAMNIEQVPGDFNEPESLVPAFRGAQKFFSVTPFVQNLAQLGINAIEAAKRAGVEHVVRSSALGASEKAAIAMGRRHGQVEEYLKRTGMALTILQPNTFMQSYFAHSATIKAHSYFYVPQGDGRVSLVDARDIATAAVATLTESGHEGKRYSITGSESLSNYDVAEKLSLALGREIRYLDVTEEQWGRAMRARGTPDWMIQSLLELFRISKAGYAAEVSPAVEQIVKRRPISFNQFLHEYQEEVFDVKPPSGRN